MHEDHLGTPQVITGSGGTVLWQADYRPFGEVEVTTSLIDNDLRFPGQLFDPESGLHYNYFRDYDPSLGRYVQSDPIGLAGGQNTYAYGHLRPLILLDQLGLAPYPGDAAVYPPMMNCSCVEVCMESPGSLTPCSLLPKIVPRSIHLACEMLLKGMSCTRACYSFCDGDTPVNPFPREETQEQCEDK